MTRIVVDIKTWVFYLLTGDKSVARLLRLITKNKVVNLLSKKLLDQLTEMVSTSPVRLKVEPSLAKEFITLLIGKSKFIRPTSEIKRKVEKSDEEYVNMAIDGKSSYIITAEVGRFLKVDGYKKINVIELESFLENFED